MQKRKFLVLSFTMLVAIVLLSAGVGAPVVTGATCVPDNCFTTTVSGISYMVTIVPGPDGKFPIINTTLNTAEFIYEIRQTANLSYGISYLDIKIDNNVVTGPLSGGKSSNIQTFIYGINGSSLGPNDEYTIYPSPIGDGAFGNGDQNNFVLRWKTIPATPFRFSVKIKNQTRAIGADPNLINIKSKSGTAAVEGSVLGPFVLPPISQSGSGIGFDVGEVPCSIKVTLNTDGSIAGGTLTPPECCPPTGCNVPVEDSSITSICEGGPLPGCNTIVGPIIWVSKGVWMQADFGSPPCAICNYVGGRRICPTYTTIPPCK